MSTAPMQIYQVGGSVRDELLGLPSADRDWVVVGASPQQMLQLGYLPVGKDFPVFLHPDTHEEYALARTERKSARGHKGFVCYSAPDVTLEQDLQRRDLTINAIARDGLGKLIDPYHGLADLQNRRLRHVSSAFSEDPLRVLRVARFHARFANLGFQVAPETLSLMRKMTDLGELQSLSAERVWGELAKALQTPMPAVFFSSLAECNALQILFPEIDSAGIAGLERASSVNTAPLIRFSALCHRAALQPGFIRNPMFSKIPNDFRDLALLTAKYHSELAKGKLHKAEQLSTILQGTDALRRPERFLQLLSASAAIHDALHFPLNFWQQALHIVQSSKITRLVQQGLTGEALGRAIKQQRLQDLRRFLDNFAV